MRKKKEYSIEDIKRLQEKLDDLKNKYSNFTTKIQDDKTNSFTTHIEEPSDYYNKLLSFDPDSSPVAWEHYRKYYKPSEFIKIDDTDFYFYYLRYTKLQNVYRLHAQPKSIRNAWNKNVCRGINSKAPSLSGDTDFNFNPKHFTNKSFDTISTETKNLLQSCREMHHTLINFSLMLSTGNMQGFKGKICDDRLDRFIYFLERYYTEPDKQNTHIASFATEQNRPTLINYLNSFNGIYDYCKKIYFINDEELIKKLIDSGKQPIIGAIDKKGKEISPEQRVIEYMELAIEFWEAKAEYFDNPENIVTQPEN